MRRLILSHFYLDWPCCLFFVRRRRAQISNMPEDLRARLADINATWGKEIE